MAGRESSSSLHIAMYPWFALGHITSFLHLSNKLAERGHKISFLLPTKTRSRFEPLNRHRDLIFLIPISVPKVNGLPVGAETTADVPFHSHSLLLTAMDQTKPVIETHLRNLNPQFVFYDFTHWLPLLARDLGIKSLHYCTISPAAVGYLISPERHLRGKQNRSLMASELMKPPANFPHSSIRLKAFEARGLAGVGMAENGTGISFVERQLLCFEECDAISFKTCLEMEGPYCRYIKEQFKKPVILAGPIVPEPSESSLKEKLVKFLNKFDPNTLVFCSFGSECRLEKDQFQELLLGLELTSRPFLVATKPPVGTELSSSSTIESAFPEGFEGRTRGRGFVTGEWVQQQRILDHGSVGCFVTHCGSGSLSEAMVKRCQLVLLPNVGDQIINARLMGGDLRVGVEVEKREEDGKFSKEGVCEAVRVVMGEGSVVGEMVRENHRKWREFILRDGVEERHVNEFVHRLHALLS